MPTPCPLSFAPTRSHYLYVTKFKRRQNKKLGKMSDFLGFFIYTLDEPLFKSVNGLIKEKLAHVVLFIYAHRVYPGKKWLNSNNLVGVTISALRIKSPRSPKVWLRHCTWLAYYEMWFRLTQFVNKLIYHVQSRTL